MNFNDLHKLHYFKEAAEALNYTKTAQKLGASPSGVQQAVKSLEESLGQKLFIRKSKGLALTPEGKLLYDRTLNIFKELELAEKELISKRRKSEIKKIKLLTTPGMASEWLYSCLPLIKDIYPNIILELYSSNLEISLDSGDFDIYIGPHVETPSHYKRLPLGVTNFRLYYSKNYIKKYGSLTSIKDLDKHMLIKFSGLLQAYFSEANNAFSDIDADENYSYIIDAYLAEYNLVKEGAGIACLCKEFVEVKNDTSIIDVFPKMKSVSVPLYMFYNKKEDKNIIQNIYDILKKTSMFIV